MLILSLHEMIYEKKTREIKACSAAKRYALSLFVLSRGSFFLIGGDTNRDRFMRRKRGKSKLVKLGGGRSHH